MEKPTFFSVSVAAVYVLLVFSMQPIAQEAHREKKMWSNPETINKLDPTAIANYVVQVDDSFMKCAPC